MVLTSVLTMCQPLPEHQSAILECWLCPNKDCELASPKKAAHRWSGTCLAACGVMQCLALRLVQSSKCMPVPANWQGPSLLRRDGWCRLDIAAGEWTIFKDRLKQAKELCGKGGDWERKNRLKVYEALFLLATRDFKHAASLFLDSIATFTAYAPALCCHSCPKA